MKRYLLFFLRTYALWCAFSGSYERRTIFLLISSEIVETLRWRMRAMSLRRYLFCLRIAISFRSLLERCENFVCFFHTYRVLHFGFKWDCAKTTRTPQSEHFLLIIYFL